MKIKRIYYTAPCVAELLEREIGAPEAGEVQVKLCVSTISSGTERANLIGDANIRSDRPAGEVIWPRSGGYSSAGIVTAVGEGVTEFEVGDRVSLSWSKHASLINMPAKNVHKLPDEVSFEAAALLHIGTFPLAAIRKCRLELGESAIVMGMGVLGLLALPLLKAAGAAPIIAVDPIAEKREKALAMGADFALDPLDGDFAEIVKELTGGGAKVGIEVTGVGAGLNGILDCMARYGRVALLGCTRNSDFTVDYYRKVHGPGITLVGAHTDARPKCESHGGWFTEKEDVEAMLRLHRLGRLNFAEFVDETHAPEEAPAVYARLAVEKAFPVVQFDWRKLK